MTEQDPETHFTDEAFIEQPPESHVKQMPELNEAEQQVVDRYRARLASPSRPRNRGEWGTTVKSSLPKMLARNRSISEQIIGHVDNSG